MNDVTKATGGALAGLAALKKNLGNVRSRIPASSPNPYLRLLKDGQWVFGAEDKLLKTGTEVVINPMSIEHGYSCWTRYDNDPAHKGKKNELLGEVMVPLTQMPPEAAELPRHAYPWVEQLAFDVVVMEGLHKGVQVKYKVSSVGGMTAAKGLLDAIMARLDEDTQYVCPIVALEVDSYRHKQWGKTYTPVLSIVGWADLNGNEDPEFAPEDDGAPEPVTSRLPQPEPEPAPTARRSRAPAPAAEPPAAEEPAAEEPEAITTTAPVRRRRG